MSRGPSRAVLVARSARTIRCSSALSSGHASAFRMRTYRPSVVSRPAFTAAPKPAFLPISTSRAAGNSVRTRSALPSEEAFSITTTSWLSSGTAFRHARRASRELCDTTTTETVGIGVLKTALTRTVPRIVKEVSVTSRRPMTPWRDSLRLAMRWRGLGSPLLDACRAPRQEETLESRGSMRSRR